MSKSTVRIGIVSTVIPKKYSSKSKMVQRPSLYFCHMAAYASQHQAEVMLFVPEDVDWHDNYVSAWVPEHPWQPYDNWIKKKVSLPDVIYENVFVHLAVRGYTSQLRKRARERKIPLFNPILPGKWQMVRWLNNSKYNRYQPYTERMVGEIKTIDKIRAWRTVYIKPIGGYGGMGVTRIETLNDGRFRLSVDRTSSKIKKSRTVLTQAELLGKLKKLQKVPHLLQRGLDLMTVEGRKLDFRVVIQRDATGEWNVVGIIPKVAARDGVVTNIIAGGEKYSLHQVLSLVKDEGTRLPVDDLKQCALDIGDLISKKVPTAGLLGFDIGVEKNGKVSLIEMNPKPARSLLTPKMRLQSAQYTVGFAIYLAKRGQKVELASCSVGGTSRNYYNWNGISGFRTIGMELRQSLDDDGAIFHEKQMASPTAEVTASKTNLDTVHVGGSDG